LLSHRPTRRGGGDLGHRVDDAVLEPAGAGHLRLPDARDRPTDLPRADPERSDRRRRRLDRGDLGVTAARPGHGSRPHALDARLAPDRAPRHRHARLHRRLPARPRRPGRPGRADRQTATTVATGFGENGSTREVAGWKIEDGVGLSMISPWDDFYGARRF